MLIAVLALFLSFSETLGKSAQTEAIDANVKSADTWAFFQAKDIRRTTVLSGRRSDDAARRGRHRSGGQGRDRQANRHLAQDRRALRIRPENRQGRKELGERAKEEEEERDLSLAKYHHYELASAAFQIGIVLASAAVITGMIGLAWFAGVLGAVGLVVVGLGLFAPHLIPLP